MLCLTEWAGSEDEFERAYRVEIDEKNKLYICDSSGRFVVFNSDGKYLEEFRLKGGRVSFFTVIDSNHILFYKIILDGSKELQKYLLHIADREGNILHSFCELHVIIFKSF